MIAIQQPAHSYLSVPEREDPMELSSEPERRRATYDDIDIDLDLASDYAPDADDQAMVEETDFDIVENIQSDAKSPLRQDDEMLDDDKLDDLVSTEDKLSFRDDDLEDLEEDIQDDGPELYTCAVSAEVTHDALNIPTVDNRTQDEGVTGDMSRQIGDDMHHDVADDQSNHGEADLEWSDETTQHTTAANENLGNIQELSEVDNVDDELAVPIQANIPSNASGSGDRTGDEIINPSTRKSPVTQSPSSTQQDEYDKRDESNLVGTTISEIDAAPTTSPYLHPVVVRYRGNDIFLFPPMEQDQENSVEYFLDDESYMGECINELLVAMRSVLADDVSEQDELEISIDALGLDICESALESNTATLAQVLDIYLRLQGHDGYEEPEPLYVTLIIKPRFSHRMQYLYAAAAEGKGLSRLSEVEPHEGITPAITTGQEEDPDPQDILSQIDAPATALVELEEGKRQDDDLTEDLNNVHPESGSDSLTSTRAPINTDTQSGNLIGDAIQANHQNSEAIADLAGSRNQEKAAVETPYSLAPSPKDTTNLATVMPKAVNQENEDLIDYDSDDDPFDTISTETSTLRGDAPNSELYNVQTGSDINSRIGGYEQSPNPTRALEDLNNGDDDLVFDDKEYSATNNSATAQFTAGPDDKEAEHSLSDAQPSMNGSLGPAAETADPLHLDVGVVSNKGVTSQSLGQDDSSVLDTEHLNNLSSDLSGDNQAQADLQNTFDQEFFLPDSNGAYKAVDSHSLHGHIDVVEDLGDDFDYDEEEPQPGIDTDYDKDAVLQANPAQSPGPLNGDLDWIAYDDGDDEEPAILLLAKNAGLNPISLKRLRGDDEGASQDKLQGMYISSGPDARS